MALYVNGVSHNNKTEAWTQSHFKWPQGPGLRGLATQLNASLLPVN